MSENNLTIERVIDAPVDKVWSAWTNANELQQWWGPQGVTNPTCVWEAKPGGKIDVVMLAGPELGELAGQEWPMSGEFQEVVDKQKLVYISSPIADGQPIMDTLQTVTFEDQDGKTKLTISIEVTRKTPAAEFALSGMEMGWNQSLDKFTTYVEGK